TACASRSRASTGAPERHSSCTASEGLMKQISIVIVVACAIAQAPLAQRRAADGVAINDEGLPQYSTFSLCAIDPATGQSGASVTTRVPFVGRAVPHVRAGV